jgi:hypothetical protein
MGMNPIQTLKPNVAREEALRAFSGAKLSGLYWRLAKGPLRRLADIYVPFSFYTVRYEIHKHAFERVFAADAVNGSLDIFKFPRVPGGDQLATVATRNVIPASLSEAHAKDLLGERVLRLIFQQGFFKVSDPKLEITRDAACVHVPYWLGLYGNSFAKCRALDAVRRRFEGAKASAFFEEWLAA